MIPQSGLSSAFRTRFILISMAELINEPVHHILFGNVPCGVWSHLMSTVAVLVIVVVCFVVIFIELLSHHLTKRLQRRMVCKRRIYTMVWRCWCWRWLRFPALQTVGIVLIVAMLITPVTATAFLGGLTVCNGCCYCGISWGCISYWFENSSYTNELGIWPVIVLMVQLCF